MTIEDLDVRPRRAPDQPPGVLQGSGALVVGASFALVHSHAAQRPREESETQSSPVYARDYLGYDPRAWRVRISRLWVHRRRQSLVLILST